MTIKKWINILGKILMFASLVFIGRRIWINRETVKGMMTFPVFVICMVSVIATGIIVCLNPLYFSIILTSISGKRIEYRLIAPTYLKTNLYKYLPGNIMHYIGRNTMVNDADLSYGEISLASIIEILFSAVGALLGGFFFSSEYVWTFLKASVPMRKVSFIVLGVVFAICALVIVFRKRILSLMKNIHVFQTKNSILNLLSPLFGIVINHFINGCIFAVILYKTTKGSTSGSSFLTVVGISMIAWLVGFITPGAPGGLGIREAMLSLLLSRMAEPDALTAVAVLYRVVTILGDLVAVVFTCRPKRFRKDIRVEITKERM